MAIGIIEPVAGGAFGPGFNVLAFTDVIGPLPVDTEWRFLMLPTGEENDWHMADAMLSAEHQVQRTFMADTVQTQPPQAGRDGVSHGLPAALRVERREAGLVVESASVAITVDMVTGLSLYTERRQAQNPIQGGFLPSDRTMMIQLRAAVIWDLVEEFLPELGELLADTIRSKFIRQAVGGPVGGEGSIPRPTTTPFFGWVGLEWDLIQWPPGLGINEGNPGPTDVDYAQVTQYVEASEGPPVIRSGRYTASVHDSELWGTRAPSEVRYYILPGCLVQFYYLIQFLPATQQPQLVSGAPESAGDG